MTHVDSRLRIAPDASFAQAICDHGRYALALPAAELKSSEQWRAVALTLRDRLIDRMLETDRRYDQAKAKRLYYLSMEFLLGRSLESNLINAGVWEQFRNSLQELGWDLGLILEGEPDAALGNGGLGRLAACFLDSLATLDMPGFGYGINYEYGLFRQEIHNGSQRERPDNWLTYGTPWQIQRPGDAVLVPIYGRIEHGQDRFEHYNPMWLDWKVLIGIPHDMPVVGYGGQTVNYLRLFSARSSHALNMETFNTGDYLGAVEQEILSETVTKVLYPSDSFPAGRELRLIQEYFLVACAVRDIVRGFRRRCPEMASFADHVAIQLNDTHPALTVAELMRYFVDEVGMDWNRSWEIVQAVCGYTNHTLLPEALERWPVPLMERVLPRHLQIIYEINRHFLADVTRVWPGDVERVRRMSLIEESTPKQVRMAQLAVVGSHSVNGVAALHSQLIQTRLLPDFYQLWPKKFHNKTNGVTQRRWLLQANPGLAELLTRTVGSSWVTDLDKLQSLEAYADQGNFREEFRQVKRSNKERLAQLIRHKLRLSVDPDSLFDCQIKRIHEYKRQLLNVLHIIDRYLALVERGEGSETPRTFIFAGKAAPGYWAAKQIIRLIHHVAEIVNRDPRAKGLLHVAFLPDYRVTLAEAIIPAADLSEQISTAGTEASGTSCMKFAMNGALTIGTMDGANIEIREAVGEENLFTFGLGAAEIEAQRQSYQPRELYESNEVIRRVLDSIRENRFSRSQPGLFDWVVDALTIGGDPYFHLMDFEDYRAAQRRVGETFRDSAVWAKKAILNVARIGQFSSDRTIRDYARDVWGIRSVPPSDLRSS